MFLSLGPINEGTAVVRTDYIRAITVLIAMMTTAVVAMLVGDEAAMAQDSGGDTTPPTVLKTFPEDNAQNVARDVTVKAKFSEGMRKSSINGMTVWLRPGNYTYEDLNDCCTPLPLMEYDLSYKKANRTVKLNPRGEWNYKKDTYTNKLKANTTYTAIVEGAGDTDEEAVKDKAGNEMATDKIWHFTTGAT